MKKDELELQKFNTSYKVMEGDFDSPEWEEIEQYHHIVVDDDGNISGYIYEDETVFESFVGKDCNITIAEIAKDIDVLRSAGGSFWDGYKYVMRPSIFDRNDEKFLGSFKSLKDAEQAILMYLLEEK